MSDEQVVKLAVFNGLTLGYATKLLEVLPNVPARDRALKKLVQVQKRGERAVRGL